MGISIDGGAWAIYVRTTKLSYTRTVVADTGRVGVRRACLIPIARITEAKRRLDALAALDTCRAGLSAGNRRTIDRASLDHG